MSVKLKDIAGLTGVSITTVSLVLNNKPIRISEEKRVEILATAEKLKYKANLAARSLVTKRSQVLGLIVPDIENVYFSKLAKNLEEICLQHNYVLLILNSNDRLESDKLLLDILVGRGVDGIFICPSNESFFSEDLKNKLAELTLPVIMVDRVFTESTVSEVFFDNVSGAFDAVSHLIEMGHKRIAIITPKAEEKQGNSRLKGYLKALETHSIPFNSNYIFYGNYKFESGYQAAQEILRSDVTAVFSTNDMMTLGALRFFQEQKKQIPEDLSMVSYDDILEVFPVGIEMTSVIQNTALLAKEAFQTYQKLIKTNIALQRKLKTTLIKRGSVEIL